MQARSSAVGLRGSVLFLIGLAGAGSGVLPAFQLLPATAGQEVTVAGRVELAGDNYFLDPRFVIVDDLNNRIAVQVWAPLEIPPSPPGAPVPSVNRRVMRDYFGKRYTFAGVHRTVGPQPGPASLVGASGNSYLEVRSVVDPTTGTAIFTSPAAGGGGLTSPPAAGSQPTEATQPAAAGVSLPVPPQPSDGAKPATPPPSAAGPQPTVAPQPAFGGASPAIVPRPAAGAKPATPPAPSGQARPSGVSAAAPSVPKPTEAPKSAAPAK